MHALSILSAIFLRWSFPSSVFSRFSLLSAKARFSPLTVSSVFSRLLVSYGFASFYLLFLPPTPAHSILWKIQNKQRQIYFGGTPHTTCRCHYPSNTLQSETNRIISFPWEVAVSMGTTSVQVPVPHLKLCYTGPIIQPLYLYVLNYKMKIIVAQPYKVVDRVKEAFFLINL